ncbi:carbonic anhydrase [Hyphomicrobium nitrativorans NL23]|uniref:Carbonic anhydrase n=1 Tax=Hyphomicrobium nitrativorans NL23 TaxID=1029756 RepID=V5SD13_9HYPH|nr:carbonic anhydrase [Hyphomicrobium nitrativorans]AHB48413.1 carbonic anhydrase [Hyphomicrobium nitrativorans NL23]
MTNDRDGLDPDIRDAIEGYERFRLEFERDRTFFKSLAVARQKPRLLWIGCSDSRVVPSQITQADPGELFEVRNIANCVPPAWAGDDTVGAAIEYAVGHLGIDDIVVCGHTGCGGIQALSEPIPPQQEAHLGRWVEYTRPAHRLIAAAGVAEEDRALATVRAHIQFQLDNLMSYEIVATGVREGRVGVHGWLYDMTEGEIQAYDGATGTWRGLLEMTGR